MPNEVGEWARRAALLPAALVDATPDAVHAGGEALEDQLRRNLLAATGGDMRLSRVRSGKGAAIKLAVKVRGAGRSAEGVVAPAGPIMLVDQPTRSHREPFAYTYNRRVQRRGRKPIHIPGVGIFARVDHRGTRGKRVVERSFVEAADTAGSAGVRVFAETARKFLSGE